MLCQQSTWTYSKIECRAQYLKINITKIPLHQNLCGCTKRTQTRLEFAPFLQCIEPDRKISINQTPGTWLWWTSHIMIKISRSTRQLIMPAISGITLEKTTVRTSDNNAHQSGLHFITSGHFLYLTLSLWCPSCMIILSNQTKWPQDCHL